MRGMKLSTIRIIVGIVCTGAVVGMIVAAILSRIGAVVTFGSIATGAIVAMMAATLAVRAEHHRDQALAASASSDLEASIARLAAKGAVPESELRDLARAAVRLGSAVGHSE